MSPQQQPSAGAAATRAGRGAPAPLFRRRTLKGSRELLCCSSRASRPTPGITPHRRRGSAPLRPHKPRWTWDLEPLPTTSKPAERPRQRRFLQPLSHPVPRKGRRQRGATYAARARLPAAAGAARSCAGSGGTLSAAKAGALLPSPCSPFPLLLPSGVRAARSAEGRGGAVAMGVFSKGSDRRVPRGRGAGQPRHRGVRARAGTPAAPALTDPLDAAGGSIEVPQCLLIPSNHGLL